MLFSISDNDAQFGGFEGQSRGGGAVPTTDGNIGIDSANNNMNFLSRPIGGKATDLLNLGFSTQAKGGGPSQAVQNMHAANMMRGGGGGGREM
jgi:hypothetical protein